MRTSSRVIRFVLPLVVIAGLVAIAWFAVFAPGSPFGRTKEVDIVRTKDADITRAAHLMLSTRGIPFSDLRTGDTHVIRVVRGADERAATQVLQGLDASARPDTKQAPCPVAGWESTRAANERADNCATALKVRDLLLDAGAVGANVVVASEESTNLLGPERILTVSAQVFLGTDGPATWYARDVATSIAAAIGTTAEHVDIDNGFPNPIPQAVDGSKAL